MKDTIRRRVGVVAALLAVVVGLPLAASAPAAADGRSQLVTRIGQFTSDTAKATKDDAPAAALCTSGRTTMDRTSSCYSGTAPVELVNLSTGSVDGRATLHIKSQATLNPRDRYNWQHTVQLEITDPVGAPAYTITGSVSMKCDTCRATGGGGSALFPDTPSTLTLDVSSPGTEVNNDHEVPVVAITAPRYSTASAPAGDTLTVRCDNTPWVSPQKQGGCVYPEFTPTWNVSVSDSRVSDVAWHISWAQNNLKRPWGRKADGPPLHRTQDQELIDANRDIACPRSLPRPPGKSCDEFPYGASYEGASRNADFSCHMLDEKQNSNEGSLKKTWQNSQRVLEEDAFWVNVVGVTAAGQRAHTLSQCPE